MNTELKVPTPLGDVRVAAADDRLTGLWFCGQKYEHPPVPAHRASSAANGAVLDAAAQWLADYFAGEVGTLAAIVGPAGTAFQRSVWDGLQRIAPGSTSTYGAVAAAIGKPDATRAAAAAIGRNPISILIPCHRVVGADGQLTGYAGGLGRKRALLALEAGQPLPWQTVTTAYRPQYSDPIAVTVGDSVRFVDRADDGEYAGWKWAVANDGRAGWVPREWFSAGQGSATAQRSYSARELAANAGDQILELDRFSGWIWAITPGGQTGWLPAAAIA